MNNKKSLLFSILAVVLMGVIISGGSFAYFIWTSGTNDRSMVNVTIEQDGITMHIETNEKVMTGLRPTSDCNNANAYVDATVTVINNSGAAAVPSLKLKAKVTKGGSGELTQSVLSHIKYSVVKPSDSCDQIMTIDTKSTESTTSQDLLFVNGSNWTTQLSFQSVATDESWSHIPSTGNSMFNNTTTSVGTLSSSPAYLPRQYYLNDNSDASFKSGDVNGITFVAAPHTTTTHQFRVYVWIDEEYTAVTVGNVISDPLQNAKIEINFSEQSMIQQVSSESIGGEEVATKAAGLYNTEGELVNSWSSLVTAGNITFDQTDNTIIKSVDRTMTGELVIANGITSIGDYAFGKQYDEDWNLIAEPSNLNSVYIPASVTSVGDYAFYESSVATVTFGDNSQLRTIGNNAFSDSSLTEITFGENSMLESIGENAFYMTGLRSIHIPDNVTYIRVGTLAHTYSLSEITFGANSKLESMQYSVFSMSSIRELHLPDSLKIFSGWFEYNDSLTKITFSDNSQLERIDSYACYSTGLTSFTVPAGVTSIGEYAFSTTTFTLTEISYNGTIAQWNEIQKEDNWNVVLSESYEEVGSITKVKCLDGDINL